MLSSQDLFPPPQQHKLRQETSFRIYPTSNRLASEREIENTTLLNRVSRSITKKEQEYDSFDELHHKGQDPARIYIDVHKKDIGTLKGQIPTGTPQGNNLALGQPDCPTEEAFYDDDCFYYYKK